MLRPSPPARVLPQALALVMAESGGAGISATIAIGANRLNFCSKIFLVLMQKKFFIWPKFLEFFVADYAPLMQID